MRWILPLILYGLIELYAYQAIKTISKSQVVHYVYLGFSVLLICYVLFVFLNYDRSVGPTQATLRASAFLIITLVPKLVVVLFLFGEDLVRLCIGAYQYVRQFFFAGGATVSLSGRRAFLSQLALGVAAIPVMGLLYGVFKGKYNFKVIRHVLHFEDLPDAFDGLKITQISDIHSGSFDSVEKIEYAIDLINAQETDMILFTGDIVNTMASEMKDWIPIFKGIKMPQYGKYSILGNHDYGEYVTWESEAAKQQNFEAIQQVHKDIDFKLLMNAHVFIEKGQDKIAIIGVENWGHNFKKAGDLTKASMGVSPEDFKILLSHDPSHWEYEVKDHPDHYHLTLSGHTHGFQFGIEIPGVFQWSPVQYMYKQWAGIYQEMGRYINVNRGFGFHAFPGRVGIWPEITVLELRKKNPSV